MQLEIDQHAISKRWNGDHRIPKRFGGKSRQNFVEYIRRICAGDSARCVDFRRNLFCTLAVENKISEAIENWTAFVYLNSAQDVWTVADKCVRARIDAGMRQRSQKRGRYFCG